MTAENEGVDRLYSLLVADPEVLERIDRLPLVDTPLHVAAREGNTRFAMEIATLKPSFAWKLNPMGLSSMHLALQNGRDQTVKALIKIDPELVRVKAKGRITPLHYVAETGNVDLLAEFLCVCPSSVEDLTVKGETAVHIAVKNKKLEAFKVLNGWLERKNEEILEWQDEDGNTALHIATSTNQPKVMKLLIRIVDVNAKNFENLTAMDIFHLHRDSLDKKVGKFLRDAKAKRASEITEPPVTLAEKLSRRLSLIEIRDKHLGMTAQSQKSSPNDARNVILVVATLIATATFQAVLNPPGGYWQDDSPAPTNYTTTTTSQEQKPHRAGKMILNGSDIIIFFLPNTAAFILSVWTILLVINGLPFASILYLSSCFLLYAYFTAMGSTSPPGNQDMDSGVAWPKYIVIAFAAVSLTFVVPWMTLDRWLIRLREKRKRMRRRP